MTGTRLVALSLMLVLAVCLVGCGLVPGANSDTPADDGDTNATTDSAKVTLSWEEPVDLDLEIWDEEGVDALFPASAYAGEDVTDGSEDEFFEFKQYDNEDYSSGQYVVSVFYAARPDDSSVDSVSVTLTIEKPDGTTDTRSGTVFWEIGRDQWHAFKIDAATGAIEDIDQLVQVESGQ